MILTEKEARKKICCGPYAVACMMEDTNLKCCASGCMAWRRIGTGCTPECDGPAQERRGYCGLAGPPEDR